MLFLFAGENRFGFIDDERHPFHTMLGLASLEGIQRTS